MKIAQKLFFKNKGACLTGNPGKLELVPVSPLRQLQSRGGALYMSKLFMCAAGSSSGIASPIRTGIKIRLITIQWGIKISYIANHIH